MENKNMNVIEELKGAHIVGITGHIRPDGDCTGSTLALYNYLKKNAPDMDVSVYLEQPGIEFSYLSGYSDIKNTLENGREFDAFVEAFSNEQIAQYAISDGQTKMGDNGKYLRLLWEVSSEKIGKEKNGH